jgi:hypothetical protein
MCWLLACFSLRKTDAGFNEVSVMAACIPLPFQLFEELTDFHQLGYESYAIGGPSKFIPFLTFLSEI